MFSNQKYIKRVVGSSDSIRTNESEWHACPLLELNESYQELIHMAEVSYNLSGDVPKLHEDIISCLESDIDSAKKEIRTYLSSLHLDLRSNELNKQDAERLIGSLAKHYMDVMKFPSILTRKKLYLDDMYGEKTTGISKRVTIHLHEKSRIRNNAFNPFDYFDKCCN